jgi:hypothetical protein
MITTRKNCEKAWIGSANLVPTIDNLRTLHRRRNSVYPLVCAQKIGWEPQFQLWLSSFRTSQMA